MHGDACREGHVHPGPPRHCGTAHVFKCWTHPGPEPPGLERPIVLSRPAGWGRSGQRV